MNLLPKFFCLTFLLCSLFQSPVFAQAEKKPLPWEAEGEQEPPQSASSSLSSSGEKAVLPWEEDNNAPKYDALPPAQPESGVRLATAEDAADWLLSQPWLQKLAKKQPRGVSLFVMYYEDNEVPGSFGMELRSRHSPTSGFDPSVSPLVGRFVVNPRDGTILYYDVVEAEFTSLDKFLAAYELGEGRSPANSQSLPSSQIKSEADRPGYTARLSQNDRRNSSGQRLTKLQEILRQDRANFHKFNKRDQEDTDDPWFSSPSARSFFDSADIEIIGTQQDLQRMLREDVLVRVEKDGKKLRVEPLD